MYDGARVESCAFRNIGRKTDGAAGYRGAAMHRLLFIEDDDQIRLALRLALEDEGYVVEEAADGRSGLAAFDRGEPDLVIVDLRLPDIQGFDVCRTIRAKSIVPIMIVTAQTDTYDLVAGLEAGADAYVTKPVVPQELAAPIRALLRRAPFPRPHPPQPPPLGAPRARRGGGGGPAARGGGGPPPQRVA